MKETRKHFEKISDDMDNAHTKNSQAPKSKPQECEDANNVLMAMNSAFSHTSLDYVFHINILHSKKRFEVLDTVSAQKRLRAIKKIHLETFLLTSFASRMSPTIFEINEDKINENKCLHFSAMFFLVMLKFNCRTSKNVVVPLYQ